MSQETVRVVATYSTNALASTLPLGIETCWLTEHQVDCWQICWDALGSPFGIVRHVTHHSIPGTARRNEEKGFWVMQSTLSRKATGKAADFKSQRNLTDDRDEDGKNRAV